jgi:hypothetical protein
VQHIRAAVEMTREVHISTCDSSIPDQLLQHAGSKPAALPTWPPSESGLASSTKTRPLSQHCVACPAGVKADAHVYVVGSSNSGKSTLISRFLYPSKVGQQF